LHWWGPWNPPAVNHEKHSRPQNQAWWNAILAPDRKPVGTTPSAEPQKTFKATKSRLEAIEGAATAMNMCCNAMQSIIEETIERVATSHKTYRVFWNAVTDASNVFFDSEDGTIETNSQVKTDRIRVIETRLRVNALERIIEAPHTHGVALESPSAQWMKASTHCKPPSKANDQRIDMLQGAANSCNLRFDALERTIKATNVYVKAKAIDAVYRSNACFDVLERPGMVTDVRFNALQGTVEAMDKRFDAALQSNVAAMDNRFDAALQGIVAAMDKRFNTLQSNVEAIDTRFDAALQSNVAAMDRSFRRGTAKQRRGHGQSFRRGTARHRRGHEYCFDVALQRNVAAMDDRFNAALQGVVNATLQGVVNATIHATNAMQDTINKVRTDGYAAARRAPNAANSMNNAMNTRVLALEGELNATNAWRRWRVADRPNR
jgi:hypothetical protein